MKNLVGLKELRERTAPVIARVQKGETLIVMRRSRPLFKITPIDEAGWETVIDFTKFKKNGISAAELIERLKSL